MVSLNSSQPAIRVIEVSKDFEVYDKPRDLAFELLTRRKRYRTIRALDNVSFEVAKGEVLGIIGANGAGKSTLLKLITGVLDPTSGMVEIHGRVTAILELGLGFNPEYSGRENIRLSALLYGMTDREIGQKLDSIIDFSGLADFIDLPVKTYSSGMFARLAFSIATAADPEILIIDEALAAGDAMFVQKCMRRIRAFCNGGRTVLLVSHGTPLLAQLCKRVVWLDRGELKAIGPALSVIQAYDLTSHAAADNNSWIEEIAESAPSMPDAAISQDSDLPARPEDPADIANITFPSSSEFIASPEPPDVAAAADPPALPDSTPAAGALSLEFPIGDFPSLASQNASKETEPAAQTPPETKKVLRRGPIFIETVKLLDHTGKPTKRLTTLLPFRLQIRYRCEGDPPEDTLGVALAVNRTQDLAPVSQWFTQNIMPFETRDSYDTSPIRLRAARSGEIDLWFPYTPYARGDYILSIGLLANQPANWEFYEYRHLFYEFAVDDGGMDVGAPIFFQPVMTHYSDDNAIADREIRKDTDRAPPIRTVRTISDEVEGLMATHTPYRAWPRHSHCPACGRGRLEDAFTHRGFRHAQCQGCKFVCLDPYPSEALLHQLYNGEYYTSVRELFEYPRLKATGAPTPFTVDDAVLRKVIELVTCDKPEGRWLEVGGGLGAFANLIQNARPSWKVTLNEFSPHTIKLANDLFSLDTTSKDAVGLLNDGARFDVISSVSVIEHIPDAFEFVSRYARLLTPGGRLVTIVPHFTRLNATISHGTTANVVPPFHTSLFGEQSLRAMLERTNLFSEIVIEQFGPAAFSMMHHVDYSHMWDVTIPTAEDSTPRSIQIEPYDESTSKVIAALADLDHKVAEYFAEHDGRQWLIAFTQVRGVEAAGAGLKGSDRSFTENARAELMQVQREQTRRAHEVEEARRATAHAMQAKIEGDHLAFVRGQQEEMRKAAEDAARSQAEIERVHLASVRRQQEEMRKAAEDAARSQAEIEREHLASVRRQQEEMRMAAEDAARQQARIESEHLAFVQGQLEEMREAAADAATSQAECDAQDARVSQTQTDPVPPNRKTTQRIEDGA